ncbi:hypothetical protein WJX73_007642 [Symbiochloris irregularis]|uniref:TF-B3 domain-containing protein n=1 Tax=Symbiochloris irregularis TaxID=706552 RepID=A0AAW1P3Q3_9CHLO
MEPSRRFIKRIPPSGVAPAFKLSLPQNVVYAHLGHWVGRPFEMVATENSEQFWTGSIVPRRNKERAEFTLKGWRLFAEAHGIRTGDQYSFVIVSKSRLVISLLAGNTHVGNFETPPSQPGTPRCIAAGTPAWAAGQHGRPDSELSVSAPCSNIDSQLSEAQAAMLLDEAMEPSTTCAFAATQSVASPMLLESGQDLQGADGSRGPLTPTSSPAATHKLQPGFEWGGVQYSQGGLTPTSRDTSSSSILTCLDFDPLMPTLGPQQGGLMQAMHGSAADEAVDWLAALGGNASMPPSWLQRPSPKLLGEPASGPGGGAECTLKRPRSECKLGVENPGAGPAMMQRVQAGFSHAQVQDEQAASAKQMRLKRFMVEMRDSQQGMLNAVASLERLSNRLVAYSLSGETPSNGSTVQSIQAEMLGFMETLKSGIWQFLSADV